MLAIAFLSSFIFLGNSATVNARTYSNSQLRKYAIKTMNKHHLRGTIEIVKDGHRQTANVGYGYYRRKIKNGNKKLIISCWLIAKICNSGNYYAVNLSKKVFTKY